MAVKAVFAIAAVLAIGLALLLPVPHSAESKVQPEHSQIQTMDIRQG